MNTDPRGRFVLINLAGQTFGKCTVLDEVQKVPRQKDFGTKWKVRCECGTEWFVWAEVIKRQPGLCCKECRKRVHAQNQTTHGYRYRPEYRTWQCMISRCTNPNHKSWPDYGGRGIVVCDAWKTFQSFISDMGDCPTGLESIERIDNNKGYEPGNCKWATRVEQANNRRSNARIVHNGQSLTFSQWSRRTGLDKTTIRKRYLKGWPAEKILSLDDFRK